MTEQEFEVFLAAWETFKSECSSASRGSFKAGFTMALEYCNRRDASLREDVEALKRRLTPLKLPTLKEKEARRKREEQEGK